jgi:hypothetical protein
MYQFGRLIIEMYQFLAKKIIAPEKARKQSWVSKYLHEEALITYCGGQ